MSSDHEHIRRFRDAYVEGIRALFPVSSVPTVQSHDGPADDDFMSRYAARAPAIVVTLLGGDVSASGGNLQARARFGAYVFNKARVDQTRTRGALIMVERTVKWLYHGELTGFAGCYKVPSSVEAENMFDAQLDKMGLALWLVAWDSVLTLPGTDEAEFTALSDFATLWSEIHNPSEVPEVVETGDGVQQSVAVPTE